MSMLPNGGMVFMHISDTHVQKFVSRIDRQLVICLAECTLIDRKRIDILLEEKIPRQEILDEIVKIYRSLGWKTHVADKKTFWILTLKS